MGPPIKKPLPINLDELHQKVSKSIRGDARKLKKMPKRHDVGKGEYVEEHPDDSHLDD